MEGLNGKTELPGNNTITVKSLDYYILNRVKELTQGRQAPTTIIPQSIPDFPVAVVVDNTIPATVSNKISANDAVSRPQTETPPVSDMLVRDGKKIYQGGRELSEYEVRIIMANTDAFRMYNKGVKRNRSGGKWLSSGIALCAFGGIMMGIEDKVEADVPLKTAGLYCMMAGSPMLITGIILKPSGNKLIRNSIKSYNGEKGFARTELKFGITGNGIGVALSF